MKFRKKSIVIEATQWFKNGDHPEDNCQTTTEHPLSLITEGEVVRYYRNPTKSSTDKCEHCTFPMHRHGWIDTVQGGHIVCVGDWIITDDRVEGRNHGHYYPCKPDIFEATYEPAEGGANSG